jgi:hypothetical protein
MLWAEFWMFMAEMPGREPDPTRFFAEQMKYSQDVQRPQPPLEMPTNYGDRNISNDGAVTSS